ncbi:Ltp family lipoprotein [Halalkalibacter krulwichiae]|uniref:Host cell surface-exposed lipoprotein n=1 Tax=Halalkalibacter krulwichiae TaxID=199441 RepID=A0A1X9MBR3_9BACI|nr:Ltp family lipoprotein [Halalkalibacter krulwichiae]ARK30909.1 Host cell surface-exposed lipoprotein [Halalkalibacter krulwichiae]
MKKVFKFGCLGIVVLFVLLIIGILASGDDTTTDTETNPVTEEAEVSEEATEPTEEPAEEDDVPREYRSALTKAEQYAKTMHMSKAGIYDQLVSEYGENFSEDAAQYAIDNIDFDWKENALKKAKSYAETMSMSDAAIYDQLISEYGEKFTPEEAQYAIDNLE